ncbi:hypothetical protein [Lapidilactobacillus salsurivasis]
MWLSGEIILSDLSLRIRLDFKTSRALCGLASNDAHRVPATTNVLRRLRSHPNPPPLAIKHKIKNRTPTPNSAQINTRADKKITPVPILVSETKIETDAI